jgi:hypothetical protein
LGENTGEPKSAPGVVFQQQASRLIQSVGVARLLLQKEAREFEQKVAK